MAYLSSEQNLEWLVSVLVPVLDGAVGCAHAFGAIQHGIFLGQAADPAGSWEQEYFLFPLLQRVSHQNLASLNGIRPEHRPGFPVGCFVFGCDRHVFHLDLSWVFLLWFAVVNHFLTLFDFRKFFAEKGVCADLFCRTRQIPTKPEGKSNA